MCIIKDDVISVRVDSRLGKEGIWRKHSNSLFFFFCFSYFCLWLPVRLFLILSMCRLTGLTFNIAVCLTFPFSRFLFAPILAFFVNVYTPVCLFENVWLCKLCVQVLIDWFDYLGIFLFVFALLLLLLLLWFCFPFFEKKSHQAKRTNFAIFFCLFPPFQICWQHWFLIQLFFSIVSNITDESKETQHNKKR